MTAIQSASDFGTEELTHSGIRPFDIGRDLRPVADLIAEAFAHELDANGRAALREMHLMSYLGRFFGFLDRNTVDLANVFDGFVWVEDDHIVGNVTVQQADAHGGRWQIANVAVAPAYRGRGISRALMETALEYAREMGGRWAVLQVRGDNQVAVGLYDRLGFETMGGITRMRVDRLPQSLPRDLPLAAPISPVQPFHSREWRALYDLASSQQATQAQWWRPLRRSDYQMTLEQQLGEWFWHLSGKYDVYRGRVESSLKRFDAAAMLTAYRWPGEHDLKLWTRPQLYGYHETSLVDWTMQILGHYPPWPVTATLNGDHQAAIDALTAYGFQIVHNLTTMRYSLSG